MSTPTGPYQTVPGITVTDQSVLQVISYGSLAGSIWVNWRIEKPDTIPVVQQKSFTVSSNRAVTQNFVPLQSGLLTSLTVGANGLAAVRGQTWIEITLRDDQSTKGQFIKLIAGYFCFRRDLSWPGDLWDSPMQPPGYTSSVTMSPAAGADISQAVPANAFWSIGNIFAKFVASAVVATRTPKFQITDGTNVVWEIVPGGGTALNVTASQTRTFILVPGYSVLETAYDSNGEIRLPLPSELLKKMAAGYVFKSVTGLIDVGDQWTVYGNVEELLNPTT